MTIDEAIVHAREVASRKFDDRVHCIRCADEHIQLAEWLEELKQYRAIGTPEECRAAVEKQKEKKVLIEDAPTAYDTDKVVEQLEDYGNEEMCYYKNTPYEKCIEECINKAIEIVKRGGADG